MTDHGPPMGSMCKPRYPIVFWSLVLVGVALIAFGVYCFHYQETHGVIVTNMRNLGFGGAPWGLAIIFYVYFVGVSFAGITVAAIARLFGIKVLAPVTRIAELLTIAALLAGAACILTDLGRPWIALVNLPKYARPASPFYGTFTLVIAGYLFSSLVYFYLSGRADAADMAKSARPPLRWLYRLWAAGYRNTVAERRRHHRSTFWLSLTILPLLVIAHSTLGFIFGLQAGRPGWYSALQAPAFVVLAGVSGIGMLIIVGAALRNLFGLRERIPEASLRWLGNLLWVLTLVYLYFMLAEELTATYAGPMAERDVAHAIVWGTWAPVFWTVVVCFFFAFLIPFVGYLRRGGVPLAALVFAGLLANVGAILKRFLIVVPSQTHGALVAVEGGEYVPGWVEYGMVAGLAGFVMVAILLFTRFFPIVPSAHDDGRRVNGPHRDWLRAVVTFAVGFAAIAMIVVGLADSFRLFSGDGIDPRIPFSPVIFAMGLMLLYCTAVVYELFPSRSAESARKEQPEDGWPLT